MAEDLRTFVASVVADSGLELEAVDLVGPERQPTLRVVVDADGGVGIDAISSVSRALSRDLDDAGLMGQRRYTLEVTSRGLSSPLTAPKHWRRNAGRLVKATLESGADVTGRILDSDDTGAVLDVRGKHRTVAFADVARAIVQAELNRPKLHMED